MFNVTCGICLDCPENPALSNCGHVFCEACLVKWLEDESTCPTCRVDFNKVPDKNIQPDRRWTRIYGLASQGFKKEETCTKIGINDLSSRSTSGSEQHYNLRDDGTSYLEFYALSNPTSHSELDIERENHTLFNNNNISTQTGYFIRSKSLESDEGNINRVMTRSRIIEHNTNRTTNPRPNQTLLPSREDNSSTSIIGARIRRREYFKRLCENDDDRMADIDGVHIMNSTLLYNARLNRDRKRFLDEFSESFSAATTYTVPPSHNNGGTLPSNYQRATNFASYNLSEDTSEETEELFASAYQELHCNYPEVNDSSSTSSYSLSTRHRGCPHYQYERLRLQQEASIQRPHNKFIDRFYSSDQNLLPSIGTEQTIPLSTAYLTETVGDNLFSSSSLSSIESSELSIDILSKKLQLTLEQIKEVSKSDEDLLKRLKEILHETIDKR